MRLVHFIGHGRPHHKNDQALPRMCAACKIDYEETSDMNRLARADYDILYACCRYIDYTAIPETVKIVYGPHFFVLPSTEPVVGELRPELVGRCVYNSLSEWVKQAYLEVVPSFIMPIESLPFGVNTDLFVPNAESEKTYDCVVYIKQRANTLVQTVLDILDAKSIKYRTINYGGYREDDYQAALQSCKFMLVLGRHESQGFALQEAMSRNIPLLVVDATSMYDEMHNGSHVTYWNMAPKQLVSSAVPYWSDECGIKITASDDIAESVDTMMTKYTDFTPRDYVLRTLSDEVCMKRVLDYFKL
jgi:hypothetical protein